MSTQTKKRIIAFGASNSTNSINKKLATYTAKLFKEASVETLDLNDYEMPIYSVEREQKDGLHKLAQDFYNKISQSDLVVISFAEYNGSYTAAFKNIFDWISRVNPQTFENKKVMLLATSPGERGALTVLENAKNRFPYQGATVVGSFHLPSFYQNFDKNEISNEELRSDLLSIIKKIAI